MLLVVSQYLGSQRAAATSQPPNRGSRWPRLFTTRPLTCKRTASATGIDTLRANVELQNEKQRLIEAQTNLDTSLFGLARLLSVDPKRKVELADQSNFFQTPQTDADQTLEMPTLRARRCKRYRATGGAWS